jgi:hypothetical protein
MRNVDEIVKGISRFIKYWEKLSKEDSTGEYRRRFEHFCYYWHDVKDALVLPVQTLPSFRDGFWPVTRFASVPEDVFLEDDSVHEEYDEDDHFVG